jgi:hypothetical protein
MAVHARRRWWKDAAVAAAIASFAIALPITPPASASASDSTTVSGTVTDRATGAALPGICVSAEGNGQGAAKTGADGTYVMVVYVGYLGAPPTVVIHFQDCSAHRYAQQWYANSPTSDGAEQITLAVGESRTGVDGHLDLGGSVSGRVTTGGVAATGICVHAWGAAHGEARSAADGTWRVAGLSAGSYSVQFVDCSGGDRIGEWYDDASSMQTATTISVALGTDTPGIDADLATSAGHITGTVTDDSATAVADACINFFSGATSFSARSAADGTYRSPALPDGSYTVWFADCAGSEPRYSPQWWDHATSASRATTVTVAGATVSDIDAALARLVSLAGSARDAAGDPVAGLCVTATRPDRSTWRTITTGPDGRWSIGGLDAGDYDVLFATCGSGNYAPRWYPGADRQADGETLHNAPGDSVAGLDATLPPGGSIAGHLVDDSGAPAAGACIDVRIPGDVFSGRAAHTDAAGNYRVDGLGTGSYTVSFSCPPYVPESYSHAVNDADATPVDVVEGAVATVDTTLTRTATLGGHVRDAGSRGLSVCVRAVGEDGSTYLSASNSDGVWTFDNLRPGTYRVGFSDCAHRYGVLDEWWNDAPDEASADPIVASSALPRGDIDAVLERGATLHGVVQNADHTAATGVCVHAIGPVPSAAAAGTVTSSTGSWALAGLRSGRYAIRYSSCGQSILDEWFHDATDQADADVVDAAPGADLALPTETVSPGEVVSPFVLVGRRAVSIGAGTVVSSGDVGTHARRRDAQPEVRLGDGVTVGDRVVGDTVATGSADTIGDLWSNERTGGAPRVLRGTNAAQVPLLRLPTHRVSEPGTNDVMIAAGVAEIGSGHYRDLVVEPGATLRLTGGRYDARNVTVEPGGQLLFRAPSELRVGGTVTIGAGAFVGPGPISGLGARNFRIDVDGAGITIGDGAHVAATVDAPNATLTTGTNVDLVGGYLADVVVVGAANHVRWWSGFADDPT